MTIEQLAPPVGAVELAADAAEEGRPLRDALATYLRGAYRVSGARVFTVDALQWVALDSHVGNALAQHGGYDRQEIAWRRPGRDLFSIYRSGDDVVAVGMLRAQDAGGQVVLGYFQLEIVAP